jgi:hypothetical protein
MGQPGVYLEDLFVLPEFRGLGIGKALLKHVAAFAVEKGCQRLQWEVLDWNTLAIEFYRAMGAEFLDEWRNVRLGGEALMRLAEQPGENGLPPISAESAEMDGARGHSALPPIRQETGERMGQHAPEKSPAGAKR